jgi:hypothetical protein
VRWLRWIVLCTLVAGCAESNLLRSPATDTTPPQIVSTQPANNAEDVQDARITITFSEPMSTGSVQLEATPSLLWGAGTWSDGDRVLTFLPADLRPNTRYTVRVTGRDRAGNSLTGTTSFTFSTGAVVQAAAQVENQLRNRLSAAADVRVYAASLAWVVGAPERVLQPLSEEQRAARDQASRQAPEMARRLRAFFADRPVSARDLVEFAFWLDGELRLAASPIPVPEPTPGPQAAAGSRASPTPRAAASPAPTATSPSPPAESAPARLRGLDELVRELYAAAGRELWARAREEHDREAAHYRDGLEERLRQATAYLRLSSLPFARMVVVPNLLGPRDSVESFSAEGVLHVVVGPSAGPNTRGVLRAFLRAAVVPAVAAAEPAAQRLEAAYELVKDVAQARGLRSWPEVVRESLVRALEARLLFPGPQEQNDAVETAFAQGFLLVRHFAARLPALERGEVNLSQFVQRSLEATTPEQLRAEWANRRR